MTALTIYNSMTESAPYSPATYHGAWDSTHLCWTVAGLAAKNAESTDNGSPQVESTNADYDQLGFRAVYETTTGYDFSGGTASGCIGMYESDAAMNGYLHLHIWATQGASNTERCVLVDNYIHASECAVSTNNCGIEWTSNIGSVTAIQSGDYIVIECGFRANSDITTRYVYYRLGAINAADLTAGGDFTSYPGWTKLETASAPAGFTGLTVTRTLNG